ncbi:hypothetical protein [Streptomyces halobius]|uniref:Peptidase inhibitor family I36 n=1 Tax=Streptomyces halobius TaxID=2879846 RepID=A0ABY4MI27_9ACTN|nr:hypothetical protein [Streptomyces halobius]UQA97305.1 hypothetical protein K9S39_40450 [Streptomyces halobius]
MRGGTKQRLGTAAAVVGLVAAVAPASSASAAQAARCPVTAWGHTGYYKCGTDLKAGYVDWNRDGRVDEVFVIAPDRTIWHTWAAAGGWKEMPGNGRADNMLGAAETGAPTRCVIVYVNKGYHYWQNCFYGGRWHTWKTTG